MGSWVVKVWVEGSLLSKVRQRPMKVERQTAWRKISLLHRTGTCDKLDRTKEVFRAEWPSKLGNSAQRVSGPLGSRLVVSLEPVCECVRARSSVRRVIVSQRQSVDCCVVAICEFHPMEHRPKTQ